MHGRPREDQPLPLLQQIPQMLLITSCIGALGQAHHLFADLCWGGVDWSASPVSMGEGGRSLPPIGGHYPSHLSLRQAQARGALRHRRLPSQDRIQHDQPFLFVSVQSDARQSYADIFTEHVSRTQSLNDNNSTPETLTSHACSRTLAVAYCCRLVHEGGAQCKESYLALHHVSGTVGRTRRQL